MLLRDYHSFCCHVENLEISSRGSYTKPRILGFKLVYPLTGTFWMLHRHALSCSEQTVAIMPWSQACLGGAGCNGS